MQSLDTEIKNLAMESHCAGATKVLAAEQKKPVSIQFCESRKKVHHDN